MTGADRAPVGKRRFTGGTKGNARIGAKTKGTAMTRYGDTLRPVAAAAGGDAQIEPVPVVVLAGTGDRVDEQRSEAGARRTHGK